MSVAGNVITGKALSHFIVDLFSEHAELFAASMALLETLTKGDSEDGVRVHQRYTSLNARQQLAVPEDELPNSDIAKKEIF